MTCSRLEFQQPAKTYWNSGLSSELCDKIANLLGLAKCYVKTMNQSIPYDAIRGPNSNSFASYLNDGAGIGANFPLNAYGAGVSILVFP